MASENHNPSSDTGAEDDAKDDKPKVADGGPDPKGGNTPAKDGEDDDSDDDDEHKPKKKGLLQRPLLLIGGAVLLLVIVIGALIWWLNARHFETTDDAYVDTHIVRLSPQIAGEVVQILAVDNQLVHAGEALVLIDSADAQTRVAQAQAQKAQAQAQVENAEAQIKVNEAAYRQSRSDIAAAAAPAADAALNLARYDALLALNRLAVAQQQLDQAQAQAAQTAAQRESAARTAQERLAQIVASRTQVVSGRDQVQAAQAQLNAAGINLGYTRITAPVDGYVTQKTVAPGNYVQPGAQMLAIVPTRLWITANFKETQLADMRVGQPVTIKVDACPGDKFRGHIDSIQRGSGQAFGILPPENATGNFVKVVQRVPVKIDFDNSFANCPLGPGLSVDPSVRVR